MRNWVKIGFVAIEFVGSEGQGSKLLRENELAKALGISRATLRSYATAALFLTELRSQGYVFLANDLAQHAAVTVNALRRWSRHDFNGMLDYLNETRLHLHVRQVLDAEAAARKRSKPEAPGDLLSAQFEQQRRHRAPQSFAPILQQQARKIGVSLPQWSSLQLRTEQSGYLRWCGVSHLLAAPPATVDDQPRQQQDGEWQGPIGFITVRKANLAEVYRREARKIYLGAAAAASLLPIVVIICLDEAAPAQILRVITRPDGKTGSGDKYIVTGERSGVVLVTDIMRFVSDLSG